MLHLCEENANLSLWVAFAGIVTWLKQVGDKIEAGDPVMVVESDKADMEVESFDEGFLAAILARGRSRVSFRLTILKIDSLKFHFSFNI